MGKDTRNVKKYDIFFRWVIQILAGSMILYHFWYIISLPWEPSQHAILHLGFACSILITANLLGAKSIFNYILLLFSIFVNAYFFIHYEAILSNPSYPPTLALFCGAVAMFLVFILTVRAFGWVFPILTGISIAYMGLGQYLPESIETPPIDLERVLTLLSADVTSPWGVYGSLLILSANYLFLFIFFGTLLEAFGGLRFIMSFGGLVASKFKSGAAALSVFTSALLGSLTGSTVANITITGSFTIPMMKKSGYRPEDAAAIETAASSGGQILPPVMGATAFVMAGYTGIPYITIAKVSFIPAIIYFCIVLLFVEITARKLRIAPLPKQKIDVKILILDAPIFLFPLLLVLILLMQGRSLMFTIFWASISAVGLGFILGKISGARLDWAEAKEKLLNGIISGCQIAVVLGLIGIIVGTIEVTGLGIKIGEIMVRFFHDDLFLLLVVTALTGMILGVGVPTPAAYIICATILSPAMVKIGVPLLQAHLFPFYYAVFAHLTPPVAIGLMVACKMAGANYWKASWPAMKAATPSFLFPFFFVYAPGTLLQGDSLFTIIYQIFVGCLIFLAFTITLNSFWIVPLSNLQMAIFIVSLCALFGYIFLTPSTLLLLGGAILVMVGILLNMRKAVTGPLPDNRKNQEG
jgi:TRAP transporter 4TM/12TM fusion protein